MASQREHTKPATVLFINLYTEMGGGEYGLYYLLKNLDRNRFHPIMMFNKRGPFVDKVEALGVETVVMPYVVVMLKHALAPSHFRVNMKASFAIRRFIESRDVRLIQCSDVLSLSLLIPTLMARKIPVIYSVIFLYEWTRAVVFNMLAFFFVTHIVSLSALVQNDLLKKTLSMKKKSRLIYWGVDTQRFSPVSAAERKNLKEKLGLPADKLIVGCIARYDVWKGHIRYLEAAEELIGKSADVVFLMAGGIVTGDVLPAVKEYERNVNEKIRAANFKNRLIVWGHRDDVSDIMKCLDVFVCPSDQEPFGLVVLEALACGVPVVTGRNVGALEVLGNEQGVFIAEENTGASFAGAILRAVKGAKRKDTVSVSAMRNTLSRYSWPECTRNYEHLYAETLKMVV